eukprot:515954_1
MDSNFVTIVTTSKRKSRRSSRKNKTLNNIQSKQQKSAQQSNSNEKKACNRCTCFNSPTDLPISHKEPQNSTNEWSHLGSLSKPINIKSISKIQLEQKKEYKIQLEQQKKHQIQIKQQKELEEQKQQQKQKQSSVDGPISIVCEGDGRLPQVAKMNCETLNRIINFWFIELGYYNIPEIAKLIHYYTHRHEYNGILCSWLKMSDWNSACDCKSQIDIDSMWALHSNGYLYCKNKFHNSRAQLQQLSLTCDNITDIISRDKIDELIQLLLKYQKSWRRNWSFVCCDPGQCAYFTNYGRKIAKEYNLYGCSGCNYVVEERNISNLWSPDSDIQQELVTFLRNELKIEMMFS